MTPNATQTTTRYAIHTYGPSGKRYMTTTTGPTTADLAEALLVDTRAAADRAANNARWVAYGITEVECPTPTYLGTDRTMQVGDGVTATDEDGTRHGTLTGLAIDEGEVWCYVTLDEVDVMHGAGIDEAYRPAELTYRPTTEPDPFAPLPAHLVSPTDNLVCDVCGIDGIAAEVAARRVCGHEQDGQACPGDTFDGIDIHAVADHFDQAS